MKRIEDIDKNFKVDSQIERSGMKLFDIEEAPFSLHGVFREGDFLCRIPEAVAASVSEGVLNLHTHCAGGRVRFRTDSAYTAVFVECGNLGKMSHFAFTGSVGCDMYASCGDALHHFKTFAPPVEVEDSYEGIFDFADREMRDIEINLPLYSGIKKMYVGLSDDAEVLPPTPYKIEKPVVYYGSSITQGGCASRPGMAYESIISRRLSCDHINLGFSGNAKGEPKMCEYIASLDMSAFVLDYDHNAPTVQHLADTHEKFFLTIRKKQPTLPIIIMPRPEIRLNTSEKERAAIIRKTYDNAIASGDKNVYYVSGAELFALSGDEGTVDLCHPTDFGFVSMAKACGDMLERIIADRRL